MSRAVIVHMLPSMIHAGALAGSAAVVIDLLRASTTICYALRARALRVVPVLEVEDALRARAALGVKGVVLGGERGGKPIDGFDLGNSPAEYTPERVAGKTVVFTTTNGTRAALACRDAAHVLVGCFANLSVVTERALTTGMEVHLVCAGTGGAVAMEDCLFAGALAQRLVERGLEHGNDESRLTGAAWLHAAATPGGVLGALRTAEGGRNLEGIGMGADIELCAVVDACGVAPRLDARGGFAAGDVAGE